MIIAVLMSAGVWPIPVAAPVTDQVLMRAWYTQNEECRGGVELEQTDKACRWRTDTQRILAARGWEWTSRDGWRRATARAR